jgi:rhodanese-related sulfurtransferase
VGFSIAGLFTSVDEISPDSVRWDVSHASGGDVELIDVREPAEYARGHIPGAKLIPLSKLSDHLDEIDRSKKVIAY